MIEQIKRIKDYKIQTIICYFLLFFVMSILVFFIVYNSNWIFGDDFGFLKSTAIGKPMLFPNGENGRFSPFAQFDYNILLLIPDGNLVIAHYIFVDLSFFIFFALSFLFYNKVVSKYIISNSQKSLLLFLIVGSLMLKIYPLFISLVFPERTICILISVFIISYYYLAKTNKFIYVIFLLLSSLYMTYCKEPISIVLFVFAVVNLLFNYKLLTTNQKYVNVFLCVNLIIYLLLYYFIGFKNNETLYYKLPAFSSLSYFEVLDRVFRSHKILFLIFGLFFIRIYYFILKKDRTQLYYDALLFSGISYTVILIYLKLHLSHYYFPTFVLCMPSLINSSLIFFKRKLYLVIVLFISFLIMCSYTYKYIKNNQKSRITNMAGTTRLTNYILEGYNLVWYRYPQTYKFSISTTVDKDREILEEFINYKISNSTRYNLLIDSTYNESNLNTILLYSTENNNEIIIKKNFDTLIRIYKLRLLNSFGNINVYKKNISL